MSMEQGTGVNTNITNGDSKETESMEEKVVEILDKKCDRTPKTTRKSLLKEKNSSSKIPVRVKEPECHPTANEKARIQKVTFDECMGASDIKPFNIEELSKELIRYCKTDVLNTPKNITKDSTNASKSLTIDKRSKISERNGNSTALRKTSTPKISQESKDISPKLPLAVKPKRNSAHSGLTFKSNVMKSTIPKPFKFQSRPKVMRSKSVNESSPVSKIKTRSASVRAKKFVTVKDQCSKDMKEKASKLEKSSPASIDKSKTPEASSADSKNVAFKKYSAFGGLRFKPKRVPTHLRGDIFDSKVIQTE